MNFCFKFECCGIDGYKDFDNAKNWKKSRQFQVDTPVVVVKNVTLKTPMACCAFTGSFPTLGAPKDAECAFKEKLNPADNNFQKVCHKVMTKLNVT